MRSSESTSPPAVFMIAALTCIGAQSGCASRTSAATPVTNGAAIEVPDCDCRPVPEPDSAEVIVSPGPATSGLPTGPCRPRAENSLSVSAS